MELIDPMENLIVKTELVKQVGIERSYKKEDGVTMEKTNINELQAFLKIKEKTPTLLDPHGLDDSVEEPANVQIASDLGIVTDGGEIEVLQHGPDEGERPGVWLKPSQG